MPQLEHIEAIEKRLREAADTLRANSNYASNEYFLPVMGLVFLRHAYSRYLAVYDFSPEQQQNLQAIVWLYRGDTDRFLDLVSRYLGDVADEGLACIEWEDDEGGTSRPVPEFLEAVDALHGALTPFLKAQPKTGPHAAHLAEFREERKRFAGNVARFRVRAGKAPAQWERTPDTSAGPDKLVERFAPLADAGHELAGQADRLYKLAVRLIETCEKACDAKSSDAWSSRDITRARKAAEEARQDLSRQDESLSVHTWGQLRKVRYFWRQARWLTERFPGAELRDVEGLVKLVDRAEIEANDWSLTPGRYVGVAPEEVDEGFDFGEAMRAMHAELEELDVEAATLAATIRKNFEALGI